MILSHGHLDHCGLAPNLMDLEPDIYSTTMTARLCALLARDTLRISESKGHIVPYYNEEIQEFERRVQKVDYRQEFETNGYQACLYNAGHIPGSSSVYLEKDEQSMLYTGDINTLQTELQSGADAKHPESDILLIESTYFDRNHTPRKILEERFIESVKETIDNGGKAVISAFSIGRTQEIMLILKKHGIDAYVDGMGVDVFNLIKRSPDSVRDIKRLEKAFTGSNIVKPEERREIIQEPVVIVTSAGMLNGGPVLYYISRIYNDPRSKIHLTGYQVEGTNGRRALESGYIEDRGDIIRLNCGIELYDFSAHCGDTQLKELVKKFCDNGTETVLPVHGDNTAGFANWIKEEIGVDSTAPVNGETIYI
ncbi:putative exonuclease of the beta-lactamase fold involved in RNA processing [Candidatus Methanoperedens nitroreducens]|uniref:Putative exonuclease of the beta-lactamase fold involved in RNA processing n=2 Tax=Candidatus Methanoperedens nitratireducens TaxID=1392998 RepID=A0A062V4A8_9EURY|nr:putative exonuclease of the beta-lactamase fold involved in RNA processing [Candidatus Methanoperedens nitroreducens]